MRTFITICTAIAMALFCSCGQSNTNPEFSEYGYNSEMEYDQDNFSNVRNESNSELSAQPSRNGLKSYKVMSKQYGIPFGFMPIPNSWNKSNNKKDNLLFEGLNGVKVYGEQFASFSYSNNPQMNQIARQSGSKVKPVKSIERVIQEDIKPFLESKGISFVRQYQLTALANFDQKFDSYLFKGIPDQKRFQCIATEWTDNKGNTSIGILRYFVTRYPGMDGMDWGYTLNAMEAPNSEFKNAKEAFINSLVNFEVNPKWFQVNNQHYSRLAQQSNAAHQQRMGAIRAQGQAIINNGNTYSSISDSSHESWKRRNAMTDAGHAKSVNSIWDRNTYSSQSGNLYTVDGYHNNVWKNNNNQYIGTNNTNWNPNIDNATNNYNWEQLEQYED